MKRTATLLRLSAVLICAAFGAVGSACDASLQNIGEHEHLFGNWTVQTPASCEQNGLRTHACVYCGKVEEEEIPAVGHDWDAGRETKHATCSMAGERTKTCRRCHITQTDVIPTVGHNWDAGRTDIQPDCKTEGFATLTCLDCSTTVRVSLGFGPHSYMETGREEATCTAAGTLHKRCTVCNEEADDPIPALGHKWRLGENDVEPTCTEAGHRDRVCENCGTSEQDEIPALGHEYPGEFTIDRLPTFDAPGEKSLHCIRCGFHGNVTSIPKLDINVPIEYRFRLLRNNGSALSDSSIVITVSDSEGAEVAKSTYSTLVGGEFTASLPPKTYSATVTNLPAGYSAAQSVSVEAGNPYCDIYLTASPILTPADRSERYGIGSVMHDFMIPASSTTSVQPISFSQLLSEKKLVVLNFWATWCGPCQVEFPYLEQAYRQLKGSIEVLAIDDDGRDNFASVSQFASRNGYSFPMIYDTQNRLRSMFGITDIPATILIDSEGVVCDIHNESVSSADQFLTMFEPYLSDSYWKVPKAAAAAPAGIDLLPPAKRAPI